MSARRPNIISSTFPDARCAQKRAKLLLDELAVVRRLTRRDHKPPAVPFVGRAAPAARRRRTTLGYRLRDAVFERSMSPPRS